MASRGTISRSSNNRIDTIFCPLRLSNSFRSPNTDITIAVDVSTKPAAPIKEICHEKPNSMPTMVSNTAASTTCMLPSPKICLRKCHRCDGFISKPITNRKNHHAQFGHVQNRVAVVKQPQAEGADRQPRRQIAQYRAQAQPFEQWHRHHRCAQQGHDLDDADAAFCRCRHRNTPVCL